MRTRDEFVRVIDAFIETPKRILGADHGYKWGPGFSSFERKAKFPVEVRGELHEAVRFEIIGFPQADRLKFRLNLCCHSAICRLDYTDETHGNPPEAIQSGLAMEIKGPHYHSWPLNRRYFLQGDSPVKLKLACPFEMVAGFDSILRWFCADMNIDPLPAGHLIGLPPRERLL